MGDGLLEGASITLPVVSASRARALSVDLGGAGLSLRRADEGTRAVSVDLGGAGLSL